MDIQIQHTNIGSITFRQEPPTAQRTAEGFLITLPLTIRLAPLDGKIPMVTGLRGTLLQANGTGGPDEIGRLRSDHLYQGASNDHEFPASMDWHGTLTALAEYERLRNGRPPSWTVRIAGEVHLLTVAPGKALQVGDAPYTFFGQEQLRITTEAWTSIVQQLGILNLILIHIPLPDQAPGPMTPVWSALQAARDDYATGGTAGWRGCGIHLRQALTDWEAAQKLALPDPLHGAPPRARAEPLAGRSPLTSKALVAARAVATVVERNLE